LDKAPGPLPFRGQRPWQGQSMAIRSALGLRRSHQLAGSGALLSPSPPAEKATARQEQAWKASSESVGRRNRPQLSLTGPAPCEASPGPHRSSATSAGRAFAPLAWIVGWFGLVGSSCHHSIRPCLERSGRFGPLARQLEIFPTASAFDRQLGRPNTVLGMVLIKLLQCRQIVCVIVLIMLLQCRYDFLS